MYVFECVYIKSVSECTMHVQCVCTKLQCSAYTHNHVYVHVILVDDAYEYLFAECR